MTKKIVYYGVKTISMLFTACLVVVCLFFGYLFYCNAVKMTIPTWGPFQIYVVLSDSMFPVIHTDDAIIVMRSEPEKLEVNDIIAFYAFEGDVAITHRVTKKTQTPEGYEFNTKGDNNIVEDSFVTPSSWVIGKSIIIIPKLGRFLSNLEKQPYLIIVPMLLVLVIQFVLGILEKMLSPVDHGIETPLVATEVSQPIEPVEQGKP